MSEIDDGVIKFNQKFIKETDAIPDKEFINLEEWRVKLFDLNLIGEYKIEKVGFGNISIKQDYNNLHKTKNSQFLISGTQTGKYENLNGHLYTRVLDYSLEENYLLCQGPIEASSESLTHASIYNSNSKIKAIFHVHHLNIWQRMINENYPFTSHDIPYGTIEMAEATKTLLRDSDQGVFAMAGHKEGVFSYGKSLKEAGNLILGLYNKFQR